MRNRKIFNSIQFNYSRTSKLYNFKLKNLQTAAFIFKPFLNKSFLIS